MDMVSAGDPRRHKRKKAKVNEEICLGCGWCARGWDKQAIGLKQRGDRVITPVNTAHHHHEGISPALASIDAALFARQHSHKIAEAEFAPMFGPVSTTML